MQARWPEARIELIGNARAASIAVGHYYLDAAYSQNDARWSRLGSGTLPRDGELARWLGTFDLVLNFWPDADGAIATDFAALGFSSGDGARKIISHPATPLRGPAAAHFCAALQPLGLGTNDFASRIFPSEIDRTRAAGLLGEAGGELVAWHPGSGSPRKNWPVERWLEVLARWPGARERSRRLVVILGEAELACADLARALPALPTGTIVLRNTPPNELAGVFERCALFLGHDSGPAHVAAAVGCPCVLVFGPTDPAIWAPPHPHVRVVRRGLETVSVSVEDMLAAVAGAETHPGPAERDYPSCEGIQT